MHSKPLLDSCEAQRDASDCGELQIEVVTSFEDARPQWRRLEQEGDTYGFQTFDWLSGWHAVLGQHSVDPYLVFVELDGEPLMLMPLGVRHGRLGRTLVWLGGIVSDYHAPVLAANCAARLSHRRFEDVWQEVLNRLPAVDLIRLEKQPERIGDQQNPFLHLGGTANASSAHFTRLTGDWTAYYESKRSKKTRQTERRKERKLESLGELRFVSPSDPAEAEGIIDTLLKQKSRSYREMGVRDLFASPEHREFLRYMSHKHVHSQLIHVSAMMLDDEVLAAHWGLLFRDRFYLLLPSYCDGEQRKLSPGGLLLRRLMQLCCDRGVDVFDFTIGDEPYKADWCEGEMKLYDYTRAMSVKGNLTASVISTKLALKRRIKNSPRLWSLAQRVRKHTARSVASDENASLPMTLRTRSLRATLDTMYATRTHRLLQSKWSGVGAIFMLHRVRPPTEEPFAPNRILEVTPGFVESTIRRVLDSGREIVTLDEACRRMKENDFRNKFVCFTFDDGYRDNKQYALPIFQKYEAPFAVYVPTGMPEGTANLWWEVLERVIRRQPHVHAEWEGTRIEMDTYRLQDKYRCFQDLYWPLRGMDKALRNAVIQTLCDRYEIDAQAITHQAAMTWPMLREMAATGLVTIEAHTVHHYALSTLTPEEIRREVLENRDLVGQMIGRTPRHFAYPFGDPSTAGPRDFEIVADLGFDTAVTTRKGVLFPEHRDHLHALPRVSLNGDFQANRYVELFLSGAPFALLHRFRRLDVS